MRTKSPARAAGVLLLLSANTTRKNGSMIDIVLTKHFLVYFQI